MIEYLSNKERATQPIESVLFDPKADSPLTDEELRGKRERYGGFDAHKEIGRVSQALFNTPAQNIVSLGSQNAIDHLVFSADVDMEGKSVPVVFRLATTTEPEEHLHTEALVYGALRAHGIPAPRVYATRLRDAEFPYDISVMDRIGTNDLETYLRDHQEQAFDLASKAGEHLADIHRVALPGFGGFSLIGSLRGRLEGAHRTWRDAVLGGLEETMAYLQHRGIVDGALSVEAVKAVSNAEHLLDIKSGILLHGDYHNANIIVDGRTRSIAGSVDLSQAKVGDPAFDIAFYSTYVTDETLARFLTGYSAASPQKIDDLDARVQLYRLRILASKAKLRRRFGYDDRIGSAVEGMRTSLDALKKL